MSHGIALYIHIPFCPSKCHYCSFAVLTDQSLYDHYLVELKKELRETLTYIAAEKKTIHTLYFGGGTPSTLKKKDIEDILSIIAAHSSSSIKEISFELNPEHVTKSYLSDLKTLGITRLSIGIQSLEDSILAKAGRVHSRKQALEALQILSLSRLPFNVDLILGLPGSTKELFLSTLMQVLTFSPVHISSYFLTIEPGTPFQLLSEKELIAEDEQLETFQDMKHILLDHGFTRYEISNWAKKEYESQHNLMYWRGHEYLGVGLGAGSYCDHKRWSNLQNMTLYLQSKEKRNLKSIEKLTPTDIMETYLMTALRLEEGISISTLMDILPEEEVRTVLEKMQKAATKQLLKKTKQGYSIPEDKRLLHNYIITLLL